MYWQHIDDIWQYVKKDNFFFGLPYHLVTHKAIISFKVKFEEVNFDQYFFGCATGISGRKKE